MYTAAAAEPAVPIDSVALESSLPSDSLPRCESNPGVFCDALETLCTSLFLDPSACACSLDATTLRHQLQYLEWMHIAKGSILNVFLRQIDGRVASWCRNNFTESFFHDLESWVDSSLLQDAHTMFARGSHPIEYVETLKLHTFQAFGSLRIHELFDIVRDYPDSLPAIEDLRKCLEVTRQQPELLATFQNAIKTRVLQPGASTTSIIGVYTRAIKTFRHLDGRGGLIQPIGDLFSQYLRKRKDTIRCIVTSLTDRDSGELYEELERDRRVEPVIDSDDDDVCDAELWQPEPADTIAVPRGRQVDDLLSSLVSIYANQTVFVNEYRMMLAERLLSAKDFHTDRDVHTLELLKLRFGDARLQQCDIMIKDVDESKRIQANLGLAVDATVVSEHFWPPFQGDDFTLHPRLNDMIRQYKEAYAVLKNPRQLDWVPYLGFVELEIELNGNVAAFTVSPIQATLISYFEDEDSWLAAALAEAMDIEMDVLSKHAHYWCLQGVLVQENEHLTLNHAYSPSEAVESSQPGSDTFLEPSVSSKRQADADIKTLESYIKGMLRQFETLSLQQIASKLALIARSEQNSGGCTTTNLTQILRNLVDQQELEYIGGMYQLHKYH
ncbi:hypothetical protein, variant [Aphanomyces invadans]|uniref:Anaphase-promoting complex subunit 2 n=1 Tax=Aphanomyces invadans TaxID=157072 RepID=A0A024UI40_9STRA|nr:hypothetical protein, variant [Aphanomyces invadans]ETW05532.1 hypothetical protein, variant [Aphanomyces invadans]|eukprot:XP_008865309.1 hypothetical protein, variant [Aphanomyces invadans]